MAEFGECAYCGSCRNITRDHVPPRAIFAEPRPNDLITVPVCDCCHKGWSAEDEYFRDMIVLRRDVFEHPQVQQLAQKLLRGLARPQKARYLDHILRGIQEVEEHTKSGIYIGRADAFAVDLGRLEAVVDRCVRGLFHHHLGCRLPDDFMTTTVALDRMEIKDETAFASVIKSLLAQRRHDIGDGAFAYWYVQIEAHKPVTAWLLAFYENVLFFAATAPKVPIPRDE